MVDHEGLGPVGQASGQSEDDADAAEQRREQERAVGILAHPRLLGRS